MSKHFFNKISAISSRIKQHAGTQWPYVYTKCFIWYNRWRVYVKTSLCRFSFGSRLRFFFYWKKIWEFNYIWSNRYLLFFFKLHANNGIGTIFPSFLLVRSLVFSKYIRTLFCFGYICSRILGSVVEWVIVLGLRRKLQKGWDISGLYNFIRSCLFTYGKNPAQSVFLRSVAQKIAYLVCFGTSFIFCLYCFLFNLYLRRCKEWNGQI